MLLTLIIDAWRCLVQCLRLALARPSRLADIISVQTPEAALAELTPPPEEASTP
jgi:hypothetical protein